MLVLLEAQIAIWHTAGGGLGQKKTLALVSTRLWITFMEPLEPELKVAIGLLLAILAAVIAVAVYALMAV